MQKWEYLRGNVELARIKLAVYKDEGEMWSNSNQGTKT